MKTKPFSELRKKMSPECRLKAKTTSQIMLLHINLIKLQESLGFTEDEIKLQMNDFSAIISELENQLENQEDIQISTLSHYIKALGGTLKIVAHFPNEDITLAQFD